MARLVAESGSLSGKEWKIDPGLTLGREAHNTIGMPDNRKASRDHAKVWREGPGKYSVADLGSTNGTLVNDEKVSRHALVDGDELRVGEVTFRFLLDEDEKPKKPTMGASRLAELTAAKAAAAAGGGAGAGTAPANPASTITVKERVLQYQKKKEGGSVASWDVSQASEGTRWILYVVAIGVAAGLFFVMKGLF
jgi:pSer/pThr/pTyr-binding forkhead associated (FHA) protein